MEKNLKLSSANASYCTLQTGPGITDLFLKKWWKARCKITVTVFQHLSHPESVQQQIDSTVMAVGLLFDLKLNEGGHLLPSHQLGRLPRHVFRHHAVHPHRGVKVVECPILTNKNQEAP